MNNNVAESLKLANTLMSANFNDSVDVLICPPFTSLCSIACELKNSSVKVGAQNMHYEDKGAFTGEVSPVMLKDIGVEYVIIGHSERRQYFNETDKTVNKKLKSALKHGLKPILCIGETLKQREEKEEKQTVQNQIKNGFADIENAENIIIAYEPIWAIGTGKTATSKEANEMASFIRSVIREIYSEEISENMIVLYGGSVNSQNASEIMKEPDIDGALVGGASLKADEFIKIVNF